MIKDGRIVGSELRQNVQFLTNTPDMGGFNVLVKLDGTDVNDLVKHAVNAGIIVLRKRVKTKAQAERLAEGITFAEMVSAQPKDANAMAASIDVDKLDANVAEQLLKQLMAKQGLEE
jgi:hypothetical protein